MSRALSAGNVVLNSLTLIATRAGDEEIEVLQQIDVTEIDYSDSRIGHTLQLILLLTAPPLD